MIRFVWRLCLLVLLLAIGVVLGGWLVVRLLGVAGQSTDAAQSVSLATLNAMPAPSLAGHSFETIGTVSRVSRIGPITTVQLRDGADAIRIFSADSSPAPSIGQRVRITVVALVPVNFPMLHLGGPVTFLLRSGSAWMPAN